MKSKEEVRDLLGLAELPDDEFMELLEAAGEDEIVGGVPPVEDRGLGADEGAAVTDILDAVPGAFERHRQGRTDAREGRTIPLEDFL